ncbi:MAG: hypothetical protein WB987_07100 [Candidatus Acidiferrales bacterium]
MERLPSTQNPALRIRLISIYNLDMILAALPIRPSAGRAPGTFDALSLAAKSNRRRPR